METERRLTVELLQGKNVWFKVMEGDELKEETIVLAPLRGSWQKFAKSAKIDLSEMKRLYDEKLLSIEKAKEKEIEEEESLEVEVFVTVGARATKKVDTFKGEPLTAFKQALDNPSSSSKHTHCFLEINKTDMDKLSILRISFYGCPEGKPESVLCLSPIDEVEPKILPKPSAIWFTGSGFIECLYLPMAGFTASEMASMGALSALNNWPCEVSVTNKVNHPGFTRKEAGGKKGSKPYYYKQSLEGALSHWRGGAFNNVHQEEIDGWLAERGMEVGGRYTHDNCPIDPDHVSAGTKGSDPVAVTEDGITCFSCHGRTGKGTMKWPKLIGDYNQPLLVKAANKFVPWSHAQYIVQGQYGERLPSDIGRNCYKALVRLLSTHEDDPRALMVMDPDIRSVRTIDGGWALSGTLEPIKISAQALNDFPTCLDMCGDEEKGYKLRPNALRIDAHLNHPRVPGWASIYPVYGAKVYHHWIPFTKYPETVISEVHLPKYSKTPNYIRPDKRLGWEDCKQQFSKLFPGINLGYLELLIMARGVVEGTFDPAWIVATGPSGSAKTKTVDIACQVLGDHFASVIWNPNRFAQTIGETTNHHGFILLDEFAKYKRGVSQKDIFNELLHIDGKFSFHRLYYGTVQAYLNSVLVITNTHYPDSIMEHKQFGRRVIHVHLGVSVPDWKKSMGDISQLRNLHPRLCDSFLSHVIDKHFNSAQAITSPIQFLSKAREMGFLTIEESNKSQSENQAFPIDKLIGQLFFLLQELPDCSSAWSGRGWKKLNLDDEDCKALKILRHLVPGFSHQAKFDPFYFKERDLNKILDAVEKSHDFPLTINFSRVMGRVVGIKFAQRDKENRRKWNFNGDIPINLKRIDFLEPDEEEI